MGKPIRAKNLLSLMENHGEQAVHDHLETALESGKVEASDFSIKDLAETFLGENWKKKFRAAASGSSFALQEAGQAVHTTAFTNITGQIIFSEIRRGFSLEQFVFSRLVGQAQSRIRGTETVPEISPIGDLGEIVGEGQEYPSFGVGETTYTIPAKTKRGMKIELTEEAIFFDLTSDVVRQAGRVGEWMGLQREKAIIDVFTGQTNNYIRNGTATNTYLTAGAYINNQATTDLQDWQDIEQAELLFVDILDPDTNEPIADQLRASGTTLVVMPHKEHTARRILNATENRTTDGGGTNEMLAANTLRGYNVVSSNLLYRQVLATIEPTAATAQDIWWLGDLSRAFRWYEVWPLQVFTQGQDNPDAFERDVTMKFKARYYGVAAVAEPRYIVRMENVAV